MSEPIFLHEMTLRDTKKLSVRHSTAAAEQQQQDTDNWSASCFTAAALQHKRLFDLQHYDLLSTLLNVICVPRIVYINMNRRISTIVTNT